VSDVTVQDLASGVDCANFNARSTIIADRIGLIRPFTFSPRFRGHSNRTVDDTEPFCVGTISVFQRTVFRADYPTNYYQKHSGVMDGISCVTGILCAWKPVLVLLT
jgi:hypothetical protein